VLFQSSRANAPLDRVNTQRPGAAMRPRPTARPTQWHIAANLMDKAYNLRESRNQPSLTHVYICSARFNLGDLAQSSELTLIASEDLFHLTFWYGPPCSITHFLLKEPEPDTPRNPEEGGSRRPVEHEMKFSRYTFGFSRWTFGTKRDKYELLVKAKGRHL